VRANEQAGCEPDWVSQGRELLADPQTRLREHAERWGVAIESVHETGSSLIAYGKRAETSIVLKLVKRYGDEWFSGEVVHAFAGHGIARVYDFAGGALLLERLSPGTSLVAISRSGDDERATETLARLMAALLPEHVTTRSVRVAEWGRGFGRYLASSDAAIPRELVVRAGLTFTNLVDSQRNPRLLHGDLQHSNVLFDRARGWVAIDPKGVIGELEVEPGALLRNPQEAPELFTARRTIERRVQQLTDALDLDRNRVLAWAFAQAVLSAIWSWEDGESPEASSPVLTLAMTLSTMFDGDALVSQPRV
jgi:streptomycin 6-kinase